MSSSLIPILSIVACFLTISCFARFKKLGKSPVLFSFVCIVAIVFRIMIFCGVIDVVIVFTFGALALSMLTNGKNVTITAVIMLVLCQVGTFIFSDYYIFRYDFVFVRTIEILLTVSVIIIALKYQIFKINKTSVKRRLIKLNNQLSKGTITQEEYQAQRAEIISKL